MLLVRGIEINDGIDLFVLKNKPFIESSPIELRPSEANPIASNLGEFVYFSSPSSRKARGMELVTL